MKNISKLQFITQNIENFSHLEQIELACKNGINWVQIRLKNHPENECIKLISEAKTICEKYNTKLIVNDHVKIAIDLKVDGIHVGKNDMPISEVRKLAGENFIIGGTANTFEDIKFLKKSGADYIGLGPFKFTETKKNLSPFLGFDGYQKIMQKCKENKIEIPIVAIGGIKTNDAKDLIKTEIHGFAISSAISKSNEKEKTISDFLNLLNIHREK